LTIFTLPLFKISRYKGHFLSLKRVFKCEVRLNFINLILSKTFFRCNI